MRETRSVSVYHLDRRSSARRAILVNNNFVVTLSVSLLWLSLVACTTPPPSVAAVPVLLMRDSNELRFTNDGDAALYDCTVTIDGGFSATLRELPAKDRKFLMRAQFSPDMPRDEFYSRSLRSTQMTCLVSDGYGGTERAAVQLR